MNFIHGDPESFQCTSFMINPNLLLRDFIPPNLTTYETRFPLGKRETGRGWGTESGEKGKVSRPSPKETSRE